MIIALGESIVLTGGTAAALPTDAARVVALIGAFVATAALWWLYFSSVVDRAERALATGDNRTLMARDAYTYGHVLIVAGVILNAVGDELVIAHPGDELDVATLVTVIGGPVLYLLAQFALQLPLTGTLGVDRLVAAGACIAIGLVGMAAPALVISLLVAVVLIGVAIHDSLGEARIPVS